MFEHGDSESIVSTRSKWFSSRSGSVYLYPTLTDLLSRRFLQDPPSYIALIFPSRRSLAFPPRPHDAAVCSIRPLPFMRAWVPRPAPPSFQIWEGSCSSSVARRNCLVAIFVSPATREIHRREWYKQNICSSLGAFASSSRPHLVSQPDNLTFAGP